jgi:hypothetical protein
MPFATWGVLEKSTSTGRVLPWIMRMGKRIKFNRYLGRLGEEHVHWEGPAGDHEHGHAAEEVGELLGVQGGAGHDQAEVAPPGHHLRM